MTLWLLCQLCGSPITFLLGLGTSVLLTYLLFKVIESRWKQRNLSNLQILMEIMHFSTKGENSWMDIMCFIWKGGEASDTTRRIRDAGTGASPPTVNGARGHTVSLPPGIPVGPDVTEVEWSRTSPRTRIVISSNATTKYFGAEEYKRRVTLHPGNFSLEIRDLRREDAGDYEVTVTASSGAQTLVTVRLEVSDAMGASVRTVNGFRGHSVSLCPRIMDSSEIYEVLWRRLSPQTRIASHLGKSTTYFGPEGYQQRVTLYPGDFSLEIRDLQTEDTGDYEMTVTANSGAETTERVRLEVSEPGLWRTGRAKLSEAFRAVKRFVKNLFSFWR
ncbi:uncharacterized protein LOC127580912 [Pristis pectinata]|uniref:uncharacterized protein LOC127580912 n=1 Tax=Pristis pectinata TaxID=685728 RepID=UPI00223D5293|nr:uncharacterized protein LOC127580912 [Pristis pectinata]